MKKLLILASMLGIAATACQDVDVNTEPSPDAVVTVTPEDDLDDDVEVEPTATPTGCAEVSSTDGAPAPVTLRDSFFEPNCLAVSSTQEFVLANAGEVLHNFSIRDTDVDIDVDPGEEAETGDILSDFEAGTHEFFCKYHENQGMVGVVTIE